MRTAPISQIRADADGEPGRLEVEDDEGRILECGILRLDERDERPAPDEPGVLLDERPEQRPGDALRGLPDREQMPGGLARQHAPAALLDELDQPVERVERELHSANHMRTYVRVRQGDDPPRRR